EGDGSWGSRSTTGDTDLGALHVELSTWVVASSVKGNQFTTEEVVSWRNAGWDGDGDLALVGNQLVNSPLASGVTILVDLEPAVLWNRASGIWNLGKVGHDWALVGGINDQTVVEVSVEGVGPLHGDGGASSNGLDVWRDL